MSCSGFWRLLSSPEPPSSLRRPRAYPRFPSSSLLPTSLRSPRSWDLPLFSLRSKPSPDERSCSASPECSPRQSSCGSEPGRPDRPTSHRVSVLGAAPELLVLAVGTGLAVGYVGALIVGTPPNNWDSLSYHLARAAFWSQGNQVGYIADVYDGRLNANLPNSEIALTLVLEVGRNERLAGFVQFAAALSIAVGVFALARKLGLSRSQASFGGLLVLTLPHRAPAGIDDTERPRSRVVPRRSDRLPARRHPPRARSGGRRNRARRRHEDPRDVRQCRS